MASEAPLDLQGSGSSCADRMDYSTRVGWPRNAVESVLDSKDIMPLILGQLRMILQQMDTYGWRESFAPVILTNSSFFDCGIAILWCEMKSITPCLQLLPWFRREYAGLGVHDYSGAKDWERFSVYSKHVKLLAVHDDAAEVIIAEEWMIQLMSLHGRPNPLFPALRCVELATVEKPFHNLLFFAIGEPLRHLGVRALHNPSVLLAALPMLAYRCSDLTTFNYAGPSSPELFFHMSRIKALSNVFLSLNSNSRQRDIVSLRNLPRLAQLRFSMEKSSEIVYDPDTQVKAIGKPLQDLIVLGSNATQLSIQRAILPSPRQLDLTLTDRGAELADIYGILRHCFSLSSRLASVDIGFIGQASEDVVPVDFRVAASTKQALLEGARVLQRFKMINVPAWVGEPISLILQIAIPRWKSLEKLLLHVRTDQASTGRYGRPYPSLSFLATIQQACPHIEEFDFHFDDDVWHFESLSASRESDELYSLDHPMRILRINTTRRDIALGVGETSRIAMYLDQLFPSLEEVSGTAQALWRDVDMLVQSYQAVRARVSRASGRNSHKRYL